MVKEESELGKKLKFLDFVEFLKLREVSRKMETVGVERRKKNEFLWYFCWI